MRWAEKLRHQIRALVRKSQVERELDAEWRFHLENLEQEKLAAGLSAENAHYAALRDLGGEDQIKEECRDMRRVSLIENLLQDVRFGARMLRRSPGFTAVAVLSLALGIGATTAIFSVIDAVLLRQPPYENPAQLVTLESGSPERESDMVSPGDYAEWRSQADAFESIIAYKSWDFRTLTGAGEPDEVWASSVDPGMFKLLGVNAILGRTFAPNERKVIVLSYTYWRNRLGASPDVIGKSYNLDGVPYTVIGVAPEGFEFPEPALQLWVPLTFDASGKVNHRDRQLNVVARLKSGYTLAKAQAEMNIIAVRLGAQYPKDDNNWSVLVKPLQIKQTNEYIRASLLALLGAVGFVLMIVCANVAGMLLARGAARQGEIAIRAALGAGRFRLIRQMLAESLVLAGMACAVGLAVASFALIGIARLVPQDSLVAPGLHDITMNAHIFVFCAAVSMLSGVFAGLLPALRLSGRNLNEWLIKCGRVSGSALQRTALHRALVVGQIAVAMILLAGAGMMIQSFTGLLALPVGFNPDHLLTLRVPLAKYKYAAGPQSVEFYQSVIDRIKAVPGVKDAAMANNLPFTGFHVSLDFAPPKDSPHDDRGTVYVAGRTVSAGYFHTMGIAIIAGREFTRADSAPDAPCVRILNAAMVRQFWPGQNMLGKQVEGMCPKGALASIIGVVADSKQDSVDALVNPEIYEPYAQHPAFASFLVTFAVRTTMDPATLTPAVRRAIWSIDKDQAVIQARTMETVISDSLWRQRLSASLLGIFAAIALGLSAIGVFGILSYSVAQRTNEIGVRLALGGTQGDILRMVIKDGLGLALMGLVIGVAAASGLTHLLRGLVFGIQPGSPMTFVALSVVLAAVAMLAVYIPARRATKVDPMVALRYE